MSELGLPGITDVWTSRGACVGQDPAVFFPLETGSTGRVIGNIVDPAALEAARDICARCTVTTECLTWALHHEAHGIWAGTTPAQRATTRKQLRILLQEPADPLAPTPEEAA